MSNIPQNDTQVYTKHIYNVLEDISESGKVRDWSGKKRRSVVMSEHYSAGGLSSKSARMAECASFLRFKDNNGQLKLYQTWFCKVRLCPMCNWRRSLKIAYQNKRVIEKANERHNLRWVFLTLTVRNVESDALNSTLQHMTQSFNRLFKYKSIQKPVKGYFRALEVTRNTDPTSESFGTYHPHFHVLMAVEPNYFGKNYVKQSDWTNLWQKALKVDYSPIVHVVAVKAKKDSADVGEVAENVKNAIADSKVVYEVSKYPVKDVDVIGRGDEVTGEGIETVLTLDSALAHKRLIGYGGILKDIQAELKLDDPEDGDLIRVDEERDDVAESAFEVMAYWHIGLKNYVIRK